MTARLLTVAVLFASMCMPGIALAMEAPVEVLDLTGDWAGLTAVVVFAVVYLYAIGEDNLGLRKSTPVLIGAALIWCLVAMGYIRHGDFHTAGQVFRRGLEYYTELFLFLLAAMTFINAMSERGMFATMRIWLSARRYSLKTVFWLSGALAFAISPFAHNLATALLMSRIIVAVGGSNHRFVAIACVNIVVAVNAGGVFSPFGDVTTLLVWQRGPVDFQQFFALILPCLVNWLVPAVILSFAVPQGMLEPLRERPAVAQGGWTIAGLFVFTLALAVAFENYLNLPAAVGMMTGLGVLKLYGYYLKRSGVTHEPGYSPSGQREDFNIFHSLERAEWDTLMFLYGILMAVVGLGALGYLDLASEAMYGQLGPTTANVLVGVFSALVENVPMMLTVLRMNPDMEVGQWLLVTLTTGAGGSLLSIGSAAGIAVMGQARGVYTFFTHLKWAWAIALGYVASIWVHFAVNAESFG